MTSKARAAVGTGLMLTVLALSACSSEAGPQEAGQTAAGGKTARIYVVAPLSGGDAGIGLGVRNSAQLAVRQAVARGAFPGWNVEVVPVDDKGDDAAAADAARKAVADPATVAVVGGVFSSTTRAMQKIISDAGIVEVSSSATNPAVTKGDAFATEPVRQYTNFFRTVAPDDVHGPALAKHLRAQNITRAAVVHDGDDYGKALAAAFTKQFTADGGKIVATGTVDPEAPAVYSALVKKLVAAKPQAVMFGGGDAQGAPLSAQLKKAGLVVPVVGGDSLVTDLYIPRAGALSTGDLGTTGGHPVAATEAGKKFLRDYAAADFAESPTNDGSLAYDATNVVLTALASTLPQAASAEAARKPTIDAVSKVRMEGTRGKIAFDEFGDITPATVTVNLLTGGTWKAAKTYEGK